MAELAAFTASWAVGAYMCSLTVPAPRRGCVAQACIEWEPHLPVTLSDDELAQYRNGRNAAIAALNERLGIRTAIVEV